MRVVASTALLDVHVGALLDDLSSADPVPGAGAAAGLVLAMSAALCSMAARAAADDWSDAAGATAQADSLKQRALGLADRNAEAYSEALTAFSLPPNLEGEARDFALGQALERAAEVPHQLAEAAADVAELAVVVARFGHPAMRGDAIAAGAFAAAVARGAAALVAVNLGVMPEDARLDAVRLIADDAARAARRAEETVA
jgi:methenyltetrahydrofolate cyclohydrolase